MPINSQTLPTIFPPARYFTDVGSLVDILVPLVLFIISIVFLAMLFWGSFKILTAGGVEENIESGRNIITFAILGIIIVAISFFLVRIIAFILNVDVPI